MKVFFFVSDTEAACHYRGVVPAKGLELRGHQAVADLYFNLQFLDKLDVLVFQRKANKKDIEILKEAKKRKILTVYDIEDNLWRVAPHNPGRGFWTNERLKIAETLTKKADLVTVTTKNLKNFVKRLNPNVEVIRNYLFSKYWSYSPPLEKPESLIVIGWSGSPSHSDDLKILKGVLEQVIEKYNLKVIIQGLPINPFSSPNVIFDPTWVRIREYPKKLRRYDIGICPLENNQFNEAKSDLKFIEYGALGIPAVCSPVGEYQYTVKNEYNGFLAAKPREWVKYLSLLVENSNLRLSVAYRARKLAETRGLEACGEVWEKVLIDNLLKVRGKDEMYNLRQFYL